MVGFICVAAQDSTEFFKSQSDYVCTGKNDEKVIQSAIYDCMKNNKNLYFFNGVYHIDGFYDFKDHMVQEPLCIFQTGIEN